MNIEKPAGEKVQKANAAKPTRPELQPRDPGGGWRVHPCSFPLTLCTHGAETDSAESAHPAVVEGHF